MADQTNQVGQYTTLNETSPGGHSYSQSGYMNADGSLSGTAPGAAPAAANASNTTADSPQNPGYNGAPQPVSSAPITPPATPTNTPVNTNTPNPSTVNATPYTDTTNPSAAPIAASQASSSGTATQQAHAAVVAGGTPPPQNAGAGMTAATTAVGAANANQGYTPAAPVVQAYTDAVQKQTDDYAKAMSSQSQGETLVQQYQDFTNQLGIPALNTQLMNMKNIIDGTETDIRNEVTKAGGFATDSQVLAMTNARNKTMIQNYNNLLQTRSDMQAQVTTMVGLAEQDRTFANQQIDRQLNFDQAQVTFADKALTNAQSSIQQSIANYGAASVLKQAQATGDPTAVARINQTMGNGFDLATAAAHPTLDQQLKQAQINSANATAAKDYAAAGSGSTADSATAAAWAQNIRAGTAKLSDITGSPAMKNAVSAILASGGSSQSDILSTTQTSLKELQDMVTNNKGFSGIGGAVGLTAALTGGGKIPGSPGADFNAKFNQVKNDVILPNLTLLHGLGRVTDREFQALTSAVTSLSPNESPGQFKKDLQTVSDQIAAKAAASPALNGTNAAPQPLLAPAAIPSGYYQASDGLLYKK